MIRLIANGLRNAHAESFAFANFIMTSDVMRIILDQGWGSNMGMISYLPYILSIRAPSDAIQLTTASPNEKLLKFSPHGPKALIGPRTYRNTTAPVIKFRFRGEFPMRMHPDPPLLTHHGVATRPGLLSGSRLLGHQPASPDTWGPSVPKHIRKQLQPTTETGHARP